jgi:hypothetical protein
MLQRRPNTFAQTILSPSFFACDKAADHTFRLADDTPKILPGVVRIGPLLRTVGLCLERLRKANFRIRSPSAFRCFGLELDQTLTQS